VSYSAGRPFKRPARYRDGLVLRPIQRLADRADAIVWTTHHRHSVPQAVSRRTPDRASGRIAHDRGRPPKPSSRKWSVRFFSPGWTPQLYSPVTNTNPFGVADLARELLERRGGLAFRVFLVHPVEHRQVYRLGVDQLDLVAPAAQPLDHELGEPDTHPIGTIGSVERRGCGCCSWRTSVEDTGSVAGLFLVAPDRTARQLLWCSNMRVMAILGFMTLSGFQ